MKQQEGSLDSFFCTFLKWFPVNTCGAFLLFFFVLMLPKQLQTRSKGYRQRLSLTSILANHNMNSHYSTILLPFFHFLTLSLCMFLYFSNFLPQIVHGLTHIFNTHCTQVSMWLCPHLYTTVAQFIHLKWEPIYQLSPMKKKLCFIVMYWGTLYLCVLVHACVCVSTMYSVSVLHIPIAASCCLYKGWQKE